MKRTCFRMKLTRQIDEIKRIVRKGRHTTILSFESSMVHCLLEGWLSWWYTLIREQAILELLNTWHSPQEELRSSAPCSLGITVWSSPYFWIAKRFALLKLLFLQNEWNNEQLLQRIHGFFYSRSTFNFLIFHKKMNYFFKFWILFSIYFQLYVQWRLIKL